jgi:hypothetical protein
MTVFINYPLYLFPAIFVLLLIAVEIGLWLGLQTGVNLDEVRHEQVVGTRDGIGVLLSLLLGFTLALAVPRFDQRRELMVLEANALGTTSLRAQMLPEPEPSVVQQLLRQYVDARLDLKTAGLNAEKVQAALARSKRLQNDLWRQAAAVAQRSPTPITGLFVQSLNETIDLDAKRLAAVENRIPKTIWLMLVLIALLTCVTVGFSQRQRFALSILVPPLMIAVVMTLIADLDTPHSGLIRIDQQSMERLKSELDVNSTSR